MLQLGGAARRGAARRGRAGLSPSLPTSLSPSSHQVVLVSSCSRASLHLISAAVVVERVTNPRLTAAGPLLAVARRGGLPS